MYTNMYGCDQFGYEDMPELCVNPQANMPISVAYFVFLILVGAWVLFALFIGVVATGMEQAALEQIEQREVDEGVKRVQQEQDISDEMVELYREVFQTIDLEKGGDIEQDELRLGLDLAGRTDITEEKFARLWKRVDTDGSGGIDFGEFFRFMLSIRKSTLSNFNQDDDVLDEDLIIRAPVKIKPKASPLNVIDKRVFLEELEKSSSQILKTQSSGRPTSAPLSINRSFTTDTPEQAGAKKAKVRKELDDLEKELIIIDDDLLSKNRSNTKSNLSQTTEVQKEIPTIKKPGREEKTENHPNQDSPVAENVKPPIARASSLKKDMKEGDKSSAFVSPKQTVTKSPSSRPKAEEVNIEMPTLTKGANLHEKNETLTQDHQYQSVTPPPGDVMLRSKPTTPVPKSPQIVIAENADILNNRPLETAPHTPQSIYTYGNENEDTNKFIQSKQFYKRGNSLCTTETTTPKPLKKRNMSTDSITYHDGELAFIPSSGSIEEKDGLTRPQYYRVYSRQYSTPAESFHESLHEDSPSIDYFDSIDRSPNLSRTRNRPKRPVVSRACYI